MKQIQLLKNFGLNNNKVRGYKVIYFFLTIAIIVVVYYIVLAIYYNSESFFRIKNSIEEYTANSNELNQHIEELKSVELDIGK